MKRRIKDWLIVLASLADDAAVVALILLVLWFFKIPVTWPVIIILIAFFVASVLLIHKLVIPVLHRRPYTGSEGMVGLQGKVVESLAPVGLIKVKGEYWKAKSVGEYITAGEKVEITGFTGLLLRVKRKNPP